MGSNTRALVFESSEPVVLGGRGGVLVLLAVVGVPGVFAVLDLRDMVR